MKKRLFLYAFLSIFVLITTVSCDSEPDIDKLSVFTTSDISIEPWKPGAETHQQEIWENINWMSLIDDNTILNRLTIPGTHNSCANYDFFATKDTAKTQDLNLAQQLKAGVRFFDIRLSLDNGVLKVHHEVVYQKMTFNDVWKICTAFLEVFPTETIILAIQGEWNSEGNDAEIIPYVYDTVKDDSHFYGATTSIGSLKMSEVRGKILMVSRRSNLYDNRLFSTVSKERDKWNGDISTIERWNSYYKPYLDSAKTYNTNPDALYSIWTNCYESSILFGIPNIRKASKVINAQLSGYLSEKKINDLPCAIVVDHITKELSATILNLNFK